MAPGLSASSHGNVAMIRPRLLKKKNKMPSSPIPLCSALLFLPAIGEPVRLEWYNPQGERILPSKRMALHTETSRSRLIIYNAIIEDAGIYRCQAVDGVGHTVEASVVLEIYRKPDRFTR